MTDEQIKHMVNRFLGWRLPDNFNPDGGISFKRMFNEHTDHPMRHEPVGTNLFDATQAEEMVRYMVEQAPAAASDTATCHIHGTFYSGYVECPACKRMRDADAAASEPTRAAEGQEAAQAESCPVCCSTNRDYACCRGSWHDAQPVAPPTAQARRQFRVGRKVPTHIYDDARPRDVEHFFGEVAACHRTEDAAYLVELTAQARPRATKEQVQNLMMRMGGTYQQAVEALNDELGIEVSE